jgi:hypothetical protein
MCSGRPGIVGKLVAYGRYAVSRQYCVRFGRFRLYCPPPAAIIPILALGIWCTGTLHPLVLTTRAHSSSGLTFGVRPYYWPNPALMGNPPMADRTAWLALAITPMIM